MPAITPDQRFPQVGETWQYTTEEKVRILDVLYHPDWGNYILYSLLGVSFDISPPHCMNERVFIQLYFPAEELLCDPFLTENSSSIISSQPQPPWYSGLAKLWKSVTQFYSKPWW